MYLKAFFLYQEEYLICFVRFNSFNMKSSSKFEIWKWIGWIPPKSAVLFSVPSLHGAQCAPSYYEYVPPFRKEAGNKVAFRSLLRFLPVHFLPFFSSFSDPVSPDLFQRFSFFLFIWCSKVKNVDFSPLWWINNDDAARLGSARLT